MIALADAAWVRDVRIVQTATADIYRGHRAQDGLPVVIKSLRREHPTALELMRLRQEYALLRSLDLPCVVRAFALRQVGHGLELVLEDLGDVSLHTLIQSGPLELRRALRYALIATEAVAAVHGAGMIHKDVKPHHFVLRREDPEALALIDFGLATRLARHAEATSPVTEIEGSLPYLAPEQTGRMNRCVDRRSDLYSLGVTLFQLFTRRLPFAAEDPLEILHSHLARVPPGAHEIDPRIPEPLSNIVSKLLSKAPENRYQSAEGLAADLRRCLEQLDTVGNVSPFPLGRLDGTDDLATPDRVHGRREEVRQLREAFERVARGATELVLIKGPSGIGKSALLNTLQADTVGRCFWASEKFDPLTRGSPHGQVVEICRQLTGQLLAQPREALARHKSALSQALGPNGAALTEFVPELEAVIGKPAPLTPLGPTESKNRFELALDSFFSVFSTTEPLVLVLDDLQWMDLVSLRHLELAFQSRTHRHRLVVGTYRDTEVDAAHPLSHALQRLKETGVTITEVPLGPLEEAAAIDVVADVLRSRPADVAPLADVLLSKTQGNPFFLVQILTTLRRDGLLRFSRERRVWEWDLDRVKTSLVTDNVVEFMLTRLRQLSPRTQTVLRRAACIGHRFDQATLAAVSPEGMGEVRASLWEALEQGLLVPMDATFRYSVEALVGAEDDVSPAVATSYQFLHDRVQQAAYALMSASEQAEVHLQIGRMLLGRCGGRAEDGDVFAIVDHLNRAGERLTPEERENLAALNLTAGQKAHAASAPSTAVRYLDRALELMGAAAWRDHPGQACQAGLLKAQCEYLAGHLDVALATVEEVERHASEGLDLVAAKNLRSMLLSKRGRLEEACLLTVEAARLLGLDLPTPGDDAANLVAINARFAACRAALRERTIESLADLPLMDRPEDLALARTLHQGFAAAYLGTNPNHFKLLVVQAFVHLLRCGNAPSSPMVYAHYGLVTLMALGDESTAYRFGKLAIELSLRPQHAAGAGAAHLVFYNHIAPARDHLSLCADGTREGIRLSLESGDLEFATYCAFDYALTRFLLAEPLGEVEVSIGSAEEIALRAGDVVTLHYCTVLRQTIASLRGESRQPGSLEGLALAAADHPDLHPSVQGLANALSRLTEYLAGNYRKVFEVPRGVFPLPNSFLYSAESYYRALAAAHLARDCAPEELPALRAVLDEAARDLERSAKGAPSNHGARRLLVSAEIAAIEGNQVEAMAAYDEAIRLAREHRFTHQEAMANELAARFHLDHGRGKVARAYLADAHYCYERWGAVDCARQLEVRYPDWLDAESAEPPSSGLMRAVTVSNRSSSSSSPRARFDLASALHASEAIVTELVFEKVIERLMRSVLENAGAQRGFLILKRGDSLRIEASMTIDPDRIEVASGDEVSPGAKLATSIVQRVARAPESIVLADARIDYRFASDPYVVTHQPKSVLCLPLLHRGSLTGLLYLENNLATGVFTPSRTQLLQFLAAQAASAFENARLYGELSHRTDELRRANETLESQVAARTADLRRAISELWSEMALARKIQTVLLPRDPRIAGYDFAASMRPADDVGGDYYDVFSNGNGAAWVLIGDVSGHGVTAGLIMMMIQSALRTTVCRAAPASNAITPASVLSHVNACLWSNLQQIGRDQYMTITALKLDGPRVTYAGLHQDILVYRRATGKIERIETTGAWIGILEDLSSALENRTFELAPGDIVLLFTDGLTELKLDSGERVGLQGLMARFAAETERTKEPLKIVQGILGPLVAKALTDDMTLVALRYTGAREEPLVPTAIPSSSSGSRR